MYKDEMNVSGADLYSGLQKIFPDEKDLTLTERLEAARVPLLSWYQGNKRDLPWRENQDAYRIWISEIMLQQTRVEAVKPYFARFMECFPTVQALAECEEEELFKYWEGLGYYSRARNLKKAAKIIVSQYGGELPADHRALLRFRESEATRRVPLDLSLSDSLSQRWTEMSCGSFRELPEATKIS